MFHLVFKLMLLLGVSCSMEQRLKQRTHEHVNSRLFDLASKESARNRFVGNVVNQISFEFVEENWRNLEDLELDLGLIRLCELQRVEHHFAPGTRVKMASGEDNWKSLDDIARDDLILTGVQCDYDEKRRSFITFERDEEGLTEMSGELVIDDVMYDIDGRTGELYLEDEHPFERVDFDRRRLATLAPGQLDLKVHVTMAENLIDFYGTSNKAIMKVMEAFDWGWDALYDLGYNVIITSMEFVQTVPTTNMVDGQNNNGVVMQYMKTSHPPNPDNAHLTFHIGDYSNIDWVSGRASGIGAIYDSLDERYAFHKVSQNQHYFKSGVTHELGHMVGLRHMHSADVHRLGETQVYCWDSTNNQSCCDDTPACNCPESKRTIMSYCQKPEWGHHFSPGQHHKAKWQLDNPIIADYDTPDTVITDLTACPEIVSVQASSQSGNWNPENLLNPADSTFWMSAVTSDQDEWVRFEFAEPTVFGSAEIRLGNGRQGSSPKIQGSNDAVSWDDLAEVEPWSWPIDSDNFRMGVVDLPESAPTYKYFRYHSGPTVYVLLNHITIHCGVVPQQMLDDSQFVSVAGNNKVLQDQGETVRNYFGVSSFTNCRDECENNPSCNSFTYCTGSGDCSLKSLVVLGTEPTTSGVTCTSYYRKGIKLDHGLNENGNIQHMYKDVSNGVNGFCRDGNGNKKILGDWNVDSSEKCRALCDSFFACAGFQFGRNGNPQDCNLYYEADQNSAYASALTPCNKKLDKLDHDGYTWRGKGYCRDANGQNQYLRKVMAITDEIQCAKECNQDPDCKGFALGNGTDVDRCNLYGSAVTNSGSEGIGGCWAKTD